MSLIHLWKNGLKLTIVEQDPALPNDLIKFCSVDDSLFFLDSSQQVWHGTVTGERVAFVKSGFSAVDIACSPSHFYYVNETGRVFKADSDLELFEEIVLQEEASCCVHGYTPSSRRAYAKRIAAGGMGVLFLSDAGELWASGEHPQLGISSEFVTPRKVNFIDNRCITIIACGANFNVVLSHKRDEVVNNVDNAEKQIFLSSCPQCVNETILSPVSQQSFSEGGDGGVQLNKSSEPLSASTSTSKNSLHKKSNDNTSSCSEGDSPGQNSDTTECSLSNFKDEDFEKEAKSASNVLLINTEAARLFLSKQLSWVSTGGEELLAEVTGPTRIIRRNVTTVASLVYERVKNVGDKVATLSRHVSGGSDNSSGSFEEFEELNRSNASINSSLRCDWSFSENSEEEIAEKNLRATSRGSKLIRGEVWAWGDSSCGQLGIDDSVRKQNFGNRPVLVGTVSHIGVRDIWCGLNHCLVQALDGRVFGWGSNAEYQISENDGSIHSTPLCLGRAISAAAGSQHSVKLSSKGDIVCFAPSKMRSSVEDRLGVDHVPENSSPLRVLASGYFTCYVLTDVARENTLICDLAHEQCYLEELLIVHNAIVKPLSRKSMLDDSLTALCSRYNDVLHFSAVIVEELLEGKPSGEILVQYQEDLVLVYENYLNTLGDVTVVNGFAQIVRAVELPLKVSSHFSDRLPTRKTSPESVVAMIFTEPLSHIAVYKGMVSRKGVKNSSLERLAVKQEVKRKEAELTKSFWESVAGRLPQQLRTANRRILKESRASPLLLHNASRFSTHWFILMSDIFVHVTSATHQCHPLDTLWVLPNNDSDLPANSFVIITPEESMTLIAASQLERIEWVQLIQNSIKSHLNKPSVPTARAATYTFTKNVVYKDSKYTGRWSSGKMEGDGRLEWPDGRVYTGQFHNNLCHGVGRLEIPSISVYEGQWRDGLQNGHGVMKYENGDVYCGYFKDGLENGHGARKTCKVSVYVGEWLLGQKHGYGVLINLSSGEKYMGLWSGNLRNGPGVSVTIDGIYYEGQFQHDILTGRGVMVFEDGTHYEGELSDAGVFSGKGTLKFSSGDTFEGTLHGTWSSGVKISGTLHKNLQPSSPKRSFSKPGSFGQFVSADQKWKSIFRHCWSTLGVSGEGKAGETQKAWDSIAAFLNNSRLGARHHDILQTIPQWNVMDLTLATYNHIIQYLQQAFESVHHPLGRAFIELAEAYTTTYDGLVHPLLLTQAVAELRSITFRLYQVVRTLFPILPQHDCEIKLGDSLREVASMSGLLHPIILPKLYSSLLILYSLHNGEKNDTYRKRLLKWNRHPDSTLMAFLGVDKKFYQKEDGSPFENSIFNTAVETLQQLKMTFSPQEKLIVIHETFQEVSKAVRAELGQTFMWQMDDLFPVFHYVVVRSHIQDLGSEIHFIEDFMEDRLRNGEMDIMFTTLKACYFQILQEKINIC